ncbi:translocator protein 2 [Heteronotia binoei]|uniref:translocator protein 2 n=1 Tax=Heteronotia binoei TaxID=13085 RepID=UPI0029319BC5|nr:translocator protein 2 [Heteronotia binoei]
MWTHAIGFTALPHLGGFLGWLITRKEVPTWYETLKKPSWRPPNKIFPVAWTTLYTSMGYTSYLVWRYLDCFSSKAVVPLGLYGAQLALNWMWTPIFFGAHNLKLALLDVVGLYRLVLYSWYPVNKTATALMLPYLAWLTLASCLTYCIRRHNPEKGKKKK